MCGSPPDQWILTVDLCCRELKSRRGVDAKRASTSDRWVKTLKEDQLVKGFHFCSGRDEIWTRGYHKAEGTANSIVGSPTHAANRGFQMPLSEGSIPREDALWIHHPIERSGGREVL